MKRFLIVASLLILVLALTGCGKSGSEGESNQGTTGNTEMAQPETTMQQTPAETTMAPPDTTGGMGQADTTGHTGM